MEIRKFNKFCRETSEQYWSRIELIINRNCWTCHLQLRGIEPHNQIDWMPVWQQNPLKINPRQILFLSLDAWKDIKIKQNRKNRLELCEKWIFLGNLHKNAENSQNLPSQDLFLIELILICIAWVLARDDNNIDKTKRQKKAKCWRFLTIVMMAFDHKWHLIRGPKHLSIIE